MYRMFATKHVEYLRSSWWNLTLTQTHMNHTHLHALCLKRAQITRGLETGTDISDWVGIVWEFNRKGGINRKLLLGNG